MTLVKSDLVSPAARLLYITCFLTNSLTYNIIVVSVFYEYNTFQLLSWVRCGVQVETFVIYLMCAFLVCVYYIGRAMDYKATQFPEVFSRNACYKWNMLVWLVQNTRFYVQRTCYLLLCHTLPTPTKTCIHGYSIHTTVISEHTENVYSVYQIDRAVSMRNIYSNLQLCSFDGTWIFYEWTARNVPCIATKSRKKQKI